jgi:hypothetical protein
MTDQHADHQTATTSMAPIETKGNWFWKDGGRVHTALPPITTKANNLSSSSKA